MPVCTLQCQTYRSSFLKHRTGWFMRMRRRFLGSNHVAGLVHHNEKLVAILFLNIEQMLYAHAHTFPKIRPHSHYFVPHNSILSQFFPKNSRCFMRMRKSRLILESHHVAEFMHNNTKLVAVLSWKTEQDGFCACADFSLNPVYASLYTTMPNLSQFFPGWFMRMRRLSLNPVCASANTKLVAVLSWNKSRWFMRMRWLFCIQPRDVSCACARADLLQDPTHVAVHGTQSTCTTVYTVHIKKTLLQLVKS